jgi:hypothetical protein
MVYEYFTSGNIVTNPTRTIVSQVKPNTTYEITLSDLEHMKDASNVSGLSDIMTNKTINGVTSYTVTTPADNIESVIDLVRKTDNSVDVYVHSLNSPNYANFNYSGILKIYSNSALSSTVGSSVTVPNGSTGILTLPSGGSMLTNSYYFASEFRNTTLNLPVYTNATRTPRQQNQIFDIRGLAYFRDSLYTTLIGGTHFSSGIGTPTFTIDKLDLPADRPIETGTWYAEAITADGNRIAIAYKVDSFTEVDLVIFQRSDSAYRGIFNLQNVITSNTGLTYGFRYDLATDTEILLLAMSGDGSRCVVSNGDALVSVEITGTGIGTPVSITTKPPVYTNHIHALSLSLDGNTLLISGSANGHASGHAHVSKHDGSAWSTFSDLSSSKITPNPNCAYGTVSTISGDGQTVLVVGGDTVVGGDSGGYVWKFNGSSWIYTYHLLLYFDKRYATCRLSYYGDEATIASQYGTNEKYMVYTENEDYTWKLLESINTPDWLDRIKMIKLHSTHITFDGNRVNFSVSNLERMGLSFDQSVTYARSLKASNSELLYIIEGGKTNTIDSIFDYMNLRSPLYFTYNNMPYPSWTASPSTHKDVTGLSAHSGHWDAMSLSNDGNFILVGIPSSSRVRIYNVRNNTSFDIPGGAGFGNRCSMDDRARYIVVSDNSTTVRVYERTDDTSVLRRSLTRSNTGTPWNLKMSKKGNMIIMLESNNATVIRRWTSNTGDWSTASEDSNDLNQDSNMTVGIYSIDLNYDGSIIVASGRNGSDVSQVWLHDSVRSYNEVIQYVSTDISQLERAKVPDTGQSVAISAYPNETTGKYLIIVGMPRAYNNLDEWNWVFMWLLSYDSLIFKNLDDSYTSYYLTPLMSTKLIRYGRSVSVDARGRWVVLSGSNENVTDPDTGGVVIVDVQNNRSAWGWITGRKEIYQSGLTHTTGGYAGYTHHGYGIQCKISSSGTVVAVSGDTLVKSFKTTS